MLGFSFRQLSMAPLAIVGLLLAAPEMAHADQFVTFYGGHPIPESNGGGWCNDNAKHFHSFAPEDYYLYSEYDGNLYFIGDPNDFGYSGKTYQYWDHHRIDVRINNSTVVTVGYCYIPGPHTHNHAPGNESFYHQFYYNNAYYYYWYEDLWSYPGYSRYYDTYYDYWYVSFPTYYPGCSPHRDVDVSWGNDVVQRPHNGYSGYSGKGSNPKSNNGYNTTNNGRSTGDGSLGYSTSGGNKGSKSNNGYSSGSGKPTYEGVKNRGVFGRGENSTGSTNGSSVKGSNPNTGKGIGGIFTGKGSSSGSSSSGSKGPSSGSSSSSGKGSSSGSSSSGSKGSSSGGYSTGKGK
jgi:hypothetical protein